MRDKIFPESGIPLPKKKPGAKSKLLAELEKVKVGDSFVYDTTKVSALLYAAKKHGMKLTSRAFQGDDHLVRVWRLK